MEEAPRVICLDHMATPASERMYNCLVNRDALDSGHMCSGDGKLLIAVRRASAVYERGR